MKLICKTIICDTFLSIIAGIGAIIWVIEEINRNADPSKIIPKNTLLSRCIQYFIGICGFLSIVCSLLWIFNPQINLCSEV
jgi:hypothetical protein